MKFQVGKCYKILKNDETIQFRVIRNESNINITVKICGTGVTKDLFNEIFNGMFDLDTFKFEEIDCHSCDGNPSL